MRNGALLLLALVAACAVDHGHPSASSAPTDPHDLAVQALWQGQAAIARRDPASIERSLGMLAASGATPAEGDDLAVLWSREGARIAGRPLPQQPPFRGRALGAAYRKAMVEPGVPLVIEQIFLAGKKARVSLVPGGNTALGLVVAQQGEPAVCTREVAAAPADCIWLPVWTTRYRIEVRNRGRSAAPVYLVIS
jgi:hypothetical protein